jgi:MraZ protein
VFIGEFNHSMDPKGRISMPSKFRDELGETFYITKGLDNCLFVFPLDEWQLFEEKLKALPMTNKNARAFVRLFFSGASECAFDKQGRILIPQPLRDHAGIDREAVIIGTGTRVEIWSQNGWNGYIDPENIDYNEIAEHMADLGI